MSAQSEVARVEHEARAKEVLAEGRPFLRLMAMSIVGLTAAAFVTDGMSLSIPARMSIVAVFVVVPSLCLELWYVRRRLDAAIALLRLSK
jgi:hypothetical protein